MNDTLMRQWQMLRLIPRHPSKISTLTLQQRLTDEGFETTQRTLQRDLQKLSDLFPLMCDERSKPYGWSWMADSDVMDIPGMDSHTALTFWMAGQYLEPMLPKTTLQQLRPHFRTAGHILDNIPTNTGAPAWRDKVRVLRRGPNLESPSVTEAVQDGVYDALLRHKALSVTYAPRWEKGTKEYEVNPLGLVLKDDLLYLVCSMWEYQDIRLLVLHRMAAVRLLDKSAHSPKGFDLDKYIASGELGVAIGTSMKLKLVVKGDVAFHLNERPLAKNQKLSPRENGKSEVTATVQNTAELRWWLLGFGDQVEVIEPHNLRQEFVRIANNMSQAYASMPPS